MATTSEPAATTEGDTHAPSRAISPIGIKPRLAGEMWWYRISASPASGGLDRAPGQDRRGRNRRLCYDRRGAVFSASVDSSVARANRVLREHRESAFPRALRFAGSRPE